MFTFPIIMKCLLLELYLHGWLAGRPVRAGQVMRTNRRCCNNAGAGCGTGCGGFKGGRIYGKDAVQTECPYLSVNMHMQISMSTQYNRIVVEWVGGF